MSKGKKAAAAVIIIIIVAVIGIVSWLYFGSADKSAEPESETVSGQVSETQTQKEEESDTAESESQTAESTSAQTTRQGTTAQVTGYSLPLTVREAMDALQIHYGSDYEINSTVEENGLNYFSVNYNGERYASVAVDLITGRAEETIRETGAKTEFLLV